MIRRAILKAVAIPGYQVPFASREMPMPYGWGTGGVQVTAAILGPDDVLKVIDQGADDTTNAVSIRAFFAKTAGVATTTDTTRGDASSRPATASPRRRSSRIRSSSIRCRSRSRCASSSRARPRRARMHALGEYGVMHVKLYEDIARHGHIATTYAYPARVAGRYVMDPSPIPKFDNPKLDDCPALQLFGAGREKRIYAIPPYTAGRQPRFRGPSVRAHQVRRALRVLRRDGIVPRRSRHRRSRAAACLSAPTPIIARSAARRPTRRRRRNERRPLLDVEGLSKRFGAVRLPRSSLRP